MAKKGDNKISERGEKDDLPGYKHYPQEEDIFQQKVVELDTDPELPRSKKKRDIYLPDHEVNFDEDVSGEDLDIPGAELDDEMEEIGSEDEENNYFSIGGDDHVNLDEDQGENRR